jgi:hypothetical protein
MWLVQPMLVILFWVEEGANTVLGAFRRWVGILVADTMFQGSGVNSGPLGARIRNPLFARIVFVLPLG